MNAKPYAVLNTATGAIVRTFASLVAACNCADRKGDGFVMAFIYPNGDVSLNGVVLCKLV